jgi:hypothetical protein
MTGFIKQTTSSNYHGNISYLVNYFVFYIHVVPTSNYTVSRQVNLTQYITYRTPKKKNEREVHLSRSSHLMGWLTFVDTEYPCAPTVTYKRPKHRGR